MVLFSLLSGDLGSSPADLETFRTTAQLTEVLQNQWDQPMKCKSTIMIEILRWLHINYAGVQ